MSLKSNEFIIILEIKSKSSFYFYGKDIPNFSINLNPRFFCCDVTEITYSIALKKCTIARIVTSNFWLCSVKVATKQYVLVTITIQVSDFNAVDRDDWALLVIRVR
jgi:hypothetical protein